MCGTSHRSKVLRRSYSNSCCGSCGGGGGGVGGCGSHQKPVMMLSSLRYEYLLFDFVISVIAVVIVVELYACMYALL